MCCLHTHPHTCTRPHLSRHVCFSSGATMHHGVEEWGRVATGRRWGAGQERWPTRANKKQPSTPTVTTRKHLVGSD